LQVTPHSGNGTRIIELVRSSIDRKRIGCPDTTSATYGYDVLWRLKAATNTNCPVAISYDNRSRVSSVTAKSTCGLTYSCTSDKGQQLNTITVPSPTGTGNSTATIKYDSGGKVTSVFDVNGNQRVYTYNSGVTQVSVKDSANNVALSWTQKSDDSSCNKE